jgi:hypothetical protein
MGCPGGCNQEKAISPNYGRYTPIDGVPSLSHGDCEGIGIGLLSMFMRLMKCVQQHNIYTQVKVSQAEVESGISMLTVWIAAKEQDPATCEHQEKLPLIQNIAQRIVQYGQC